MRWPEVIFFASRECLKSGRFKISRQLYRWKRRLKVHVLVFFYPLSLLFQFAQFVKCSRTLPVVEAAQWPPGQRKNHKKGRFMGEFTACLCFISLTPLGEMISLIKFSFSSTVFCVFGCIFHFGVVLDTQIWGSWSKNETSESSKGDQKRMKCVFLAILFHTYTGVLRT